VTENGIVQPDNAVHLIDDQAGHSIVVVVARGATGHP